MNVPCGITIGPPCWSNTNELLSKIYKQFHCLKNFLQAFLLSGDTHIFADYATLTLVDSREARLGDNRDAGKLNEDSLMVQDKIQLTVESLDWRTTEFMVN